MPYFKSTERAATGSDSLQRHFLSQRLVPIWGLFQSFSRLLGFATEYKVILRVRNAMVPRWLFMSKEMKIPGGIWPTVAISSFHLGYKEVLCLLFN